MAGQTTPDPPQARALNRARWELLAQIHGEPLPVLFTLIAGLPA